MRVLKNRGAPLVGGTAVARVAVARGQGVTWRDRRLRNLDRRRLHRPLGVHVIDRSTDRREGSNDGYHSLKGCHIRSPLLVEGSIHTNFNNRARDLPRVSVIRGRGNHGG